MRPGMAMLLSASMLALLLAFLFASRNRSLAAPGASPGFWSESIEDFVRRKVAETYVDELSDGQQKEAFHRAMDAYVDLDYYCDFIPSEELAKMREDTAGRYAGLGIRINEVEEGLHLVGISPGGPAAIAGLQIGDTVVRADGEPIAGRPVDEVTRRLKGKAGTRVRIGYIRGPRPEKGPHTGPEDETIVTRAFITPPTVFVQRVGKRDEFTLIRLTDFSEETLKAFEAEMDTLHKPNASKGLILDLRHNGGGVLNVAVRIADHFLRKDRLIVRMEGRSVDASKNYTSKDRPDKHLDLPLVVLVDEGSASASEVVAGALQDHRRAVLVGVRTYGKFLVQSITEILGEKAALKLTTSRYYTPSGRSYQGPSRGKRPGNGQQRPEGAGLMPDVIIQLSDEDALKLLYAWDNEEGRAWGEKERNDKVPAGWVDGQLERALQLLEGEIVLQKIQRGPRRRRSG